MSKSEEKSWVECFAIERDRSLKARAPTEEEFAREWAKEVNERLRRLEASEALGGLLLSTHAGAPGARAEPFGPFSFRYAGRASDWGVRFHWASKSQGFVVAGAWEWKAKGRLWGLPWGPAWLTAFCGKALRRKQSVRAWSKERLEKACDEAMAAYAKKDAQGGRWLGEHPAGIRAALEAAEMEEAARRADLTSPKASHRGRL